MKVIIPLLILFFLKLYPLFAQAPQGIPYQAAARGTNGQTLVNAAIKIRFSILDSSTTGIAVYQETHSATTTSLGLFSVNIGMGNPTIGTFSGINWGKNSKFLKVELDPSGAGSNFSDLGTQQMMSVPYALYANNGLEQGSKGDLLVNDGTKWTKLTNAHENQILTFKNGMPQWNCPFSGVSISGPNMLCVGSSTQLSSNLLGGQWSTSDTFIAQVSSQGMITGISAGTCDVFYTMASACGIDTAKMSISINYLPFAYPVSGPTDICVGADVTYQVLVNSGSWSTSDTNIAKITQQGLVHAVSVGSCNIVYSSLNGCGVADFNFPINVKGASNSGIIIGDMSVQIGNSINLLASIGGVGTWSSSNPSVATVSNTGVVSGISAGVTNISFSKNSTACPVYVSTPINSGTVTLGQSYGGGIVAYLLQPGDNGYIPGQTHGFVVATTDLGPVTWDENRQVYCGAVNTDLGTGIYNTNAIVASYGLTGNYAALLCHNYNAGGFTDWYMPTSLELEKVFLFRNKFFTSVINNGYWVSDELDYGTGKYYWIYNSFYGGPNGAGKTNALKVRPIRMF
jgi:hypothetical protein